VNFVLVNMKTLEDVEKYKIDKQLGDNALHGIGKAPPAYGLSIIPHKVLIDGKGNIVKNGKVSLPADLDELLGLSTAPTPRRPSRRTTASAFADNNVNCGQWERRGFCTSKRYMGYMLVNCRASCDNSGSTTTTTVCAT